MICDPCKRAADSTDVHGNAVQRTLKQLRAAHAKCASPSTCPCQHKVLAPASLLPQGAS